MKNSRRNKTKKQPTIHEVQLGGRRERERVRVAAKTSGFYILNPAVGVVEQ